MRSLLLLAGLASTLASPTPLVKRTTCYEGVYVICSRGTFEFPGYGLQGNLVTAILNKIPNSNSSAVVYPASVINYGDSVGQGALNAQQQITEYYNACPTSKIVLLGYSQGAQVIGNAIAGGNTSIPVLGGQSTPNAALSQTIGKNIVAINLLGDPNRVLGQGIDRDPDTCDHSSAAPRVGSDYDNMQFYAEKITEWCKTGDPVCCGAGNDGGAHLSYLTDANIATMANDIAQKFYGS